MQKKILPGKKHLFCLLAGMLVCGAVFNGYSQSMLLGDANGDGAVGILDALMIARYSAGMQPEGFIANAADVNCDSVININDALLVARYSAGAAPPFRCPATVTPTITAPPTPTPTRTVLPTCTPCVVLVEGYVKDSATSQALAGVPVTLRTLAYGGSVTAGTAADGRYRLAAPSCSYTEPSSLEVYKSGYNPFTLNTTFTCGSAQTVNINLAMYTPPPTPTPTPTPLATPTVTASSTPGPTPVCSPCAVSARGYITDDLTALPVANATVSIQAGRGTIGGTTNADGYYSTGGVPSCGGSETVTITISAAGYVTLRLTKSIPCSSTLPANFCLTRAATPAPAPAP